MLGNITPISIQYLSLQSANLLKVCISHKVAHYTWHTSHKVVLAQQFHHLGHHHIYQWPILGMQYVYPALIACSFKKLLIIHRKYIKHINLTHGERLPLTQCYTKQRASHHHMILRCFFTEIFQTVKSSWNLLYLIQDNQSIARSNLDTCYRLQSHQYSINVVV